MSLYAHNKPKSAISEKFRVIRSNIIFSRANHEIKSVVVTSENQLLVKVSFLLILLLHMLRQAIKR